MLIDNIGANNDFTPQLRKELEDKVRELAGSNGTIKFQFDISNPNPDPQKQGGAMIWPWIYTLTPKTFNVIDPYEKRDNKQASKKVVLIEALDENNKVTRVRPVRLKQSEKGVLTLHVGDDSKEDFDIAIYLLLHPRNRNGKFSAKSQHQVFELIDEKAVAKERTILRSEKVKALVAVEKMSVADLRQFADAMAWEERDVDIIRDMAQAIAEADSKMFLSLVDENNKTIEYKATIKKATDKNIIYFDNSAYSYIYTDTRQPLLAIELSGEENPVDKLAFWFINGGDKAEAAYKKLKASIK